jgi:hypothetical protein
MKLSSIKTDKGAFLLDCYIFGVLDYLVLIPISSTLTKQLLGTAQTIPFSCGKKQ